MLWMVSGAFASPCQTQLDTWETFKPHRSSMTWEQPGGWSKARLGDLPGHRLAQIEMYKSAFKRYPVAIQDDLIAGSLPDAVGIDEIALKLAWGEPDWVWKLGDGCRALLYGDDAARASVVESCSGELIAIRPLTGPITCERLDAVVPRIEKRWGRFADLTLGRQVAVLAGTPDRWMTETSLELAFGESTTKGRTLKFLDDRSVGVDRTVQLDSQGFAQDWSHADGRPFAGGLAEVLGAQEPGTADPARLLSAPGPSGGRPAVARGDGKPRAPSPRLPELDLGGGRRMFTAACGSTQVAMSLVLSGTTYKVTARLGTPEDLRLYTTGGSVRQRDSEVIFEGLGSAALHEDGALELRLAPWPEPSCAGVSVAVPPG